MIKVGAGLKWDSLVEYCGEKNWSGLENLTLIPGNVGSSPVQNIGAYGTEVSEHIHLVECFNLKTKKNETISKDECNFEYRTSTFKNKKELIVLSVQFKLIKRRCMIVNFITSEKPMQQFIQLLTLSYKSIRLNSSTGWKLKMNFEYIRELLSLTILPINIKRMLVKIIRTKTMPNPKEIGNVGCFFKSPIVELAQIKFIHNIDPSVTYYPHINNLVKVSAGDLIKSCEWNGKREGEVSVERNRPLIILNHGNATGKEILSFSKKIQADVVKKFEIEIEPEVVILGE